jgi:hypothetical protein
MENGARKEPMHPGVYVKIEGADYDAFIENQLTALRSISEAIFSMCSSAGIIPAGTRTTVEFE